MSDLMKNIKNLREITAAGFLDCKKALEANNNDIEKSIDFLRKKGLAKAGKKKSREAKEGGIGIFSNENLTSIIQINTETDFAAKNDVFLDFLDLIGVYSLSIDNPKTSIEEFSKLSLDGTLISDHFKNIIAKIGENIVLSKLIFIENASDMIISKYVHNSYRKNIGKIVVTLKSKVSNLNEESKKFGKSLCMHIAASKPLALNIKDLDKEIVKKEKEVQLETIKAIGKPDNILNKILEGKMKKFYSESIFMNQNFILDTEKTIEQVVEDFSKINKFEIINYNLVVLGS